jgi:signal-transduction protein with cAMP-binding, CBS, and nucleotidyltransferase domain
MTNAANDENMMKIKHTSITDEYFTVSPSTPLREIAKNLAEGKNVAAAIVVEDEVPKGIIVKDDVLNRGVLANPDWESLSAAEIMSSPVLTIDANANWTEVLAIFSEKSVLAVPVVENGKLIGVSTIFDACRLLYQYALHVDAMSQEIEDIDQEIVQTYFEEE